MDTPSPEPRAKTCVVVVGYEELAAALGDLLRLLAVDLLATAGNARDGLSLFDVHRPDLAIVDFTLPDMTGVDFIREARRQATSRTAFMLLTSAGKRVAERALAASCAAVVNKSSAPKVLADAVGTVLAGETFIDPAFRSDLA